MLLFNVQGGRCEHPLRKEDGLCFLFSARADIFRVSRISFIAAVIVFESVPRHVCSVDRCVLCIQCLRGHDPMHWVAIMSSWKSGFHFRRPHDGGRNRSYHREPRTSVSVTSCHCFFLVNKKSPSEVCAATVQPSLFHIFSHMLFHISLFGPPATLESVSRPDDTASGATDLAHLKPRCFRGQKAVLVLRLARAFLDRRVALLHLYRCVRIVSLSVPPLKCCRFSE